MRIVSNVGFIVSGRKIVTITQLQKAFFSFLFFPSESHSKWEENRDNHAIAKGFFFFSFFSFWITWGRRNLWLKSVVLFLLKIYSFKWLKIHPPPNFKKSWQFSPWCILFDHPQLHPQPHPTTLPIIRHKKVRLRKKKDIAKMQILCGKC